MKPQIGPRLIGWAAVITTFVLILGAVTGCSKKQPSAPTTGPNNVTAPGRGAQPEATGQTARGGELPVAIKKLIAESKDWSPAFEPWWGKIAPDFTLTDINGNVHMLSKYRGKNVIVFFWWTYNPTCKMAAARLKELRSSIPEDSLAILSISSEPPAVLKEAAAAQGINFAVLSGGTDLQPPFSSVDTVPTTFFIDQKGQFKVAITGVIPVNDAKQILDAK